MMKKAKTAMASTADTATQALVFEFLHGFEDVLSDLGEMKERSGPEAPPFGSATGSHGDSAAGHHECLLLLEAEQNITCDNQEGQYQEDEDLHTVEQAELGLEHMDEEGHRVNHLLLEVEENCDSAALAIENCEAADFVIPQHTEDVDEAGHSTETEYGVQVVEENNGFDATPSPGSSSPALVEGCGPASETIDSGAQGCPQESSDVKLGAHDVATVEHTEGGIQQQL